MTLGVHHAGLFTHLFFRVCPHHEFLVPLLSLPWSLMNSLYTSPSETDPLMVDTVDTYSQIIPNHLFQELFCAS
jgi:hypothetical protein